ncbi:MAG: hypothetical protein ACRYFZ_05490 [Janthinobacterium lividum]
MRKLVADARAYDLVVADDCLFYCVNQTSLGGERLAYFQHDLTRSRPVTEQDYNRVKYRAQLVPYQRGEAIAFLPNGDSLRCSFQDSVVRRFSPTGQLLRELPTSIEAVMGIYSITVDEQENVWTAVPCFHQVAQYDLALAQKRYELGGNWEPEELNHPEEVICYEQEVFISDMGHQRLLQVNTRTKALSTYRMFSQSVWEYRRVRDQEVVRLQDGLYIL